MMAEPLCVRRWPPRGRRQAKGRSRGDAARCACRRAGKPLTHEPGWRRLAGPKARTTGLVLLAGDATRAIDEAAVRGRGTSRRKSPVGAISWCFGRWSLPALMLIDAGGAVLRPGRAQTMQKSAARRDSFADGLLDWSAINTRPGGCTTAARVVPDVAAVGAITRQYAGGACRQAFGPKRGNEGPTLLEGRVLFRRGGKKAARRRTEAERSRQKRRRPASLVNQARKRRPCFR